MKAADGSPKQHITRLVSRLMFVWWLVTCIVVVPVSMALANEGPDNATSTLRTVLDNIRNWLMGIAAVLAVVMVTIAGIRYLLGGGDPGEAEKAKTALKAAAVGFAIVILAPVIVAILSGILGVS